ncbi:unnamed protein product [Phytomonas sp. EM1]|nr:unnamed protein product [Phytomonas sp. EM1]|eukprot:CCW65171.1 unnamed protein product [Phytomonas sp. isolate EM1]
MHFSVLNPNNYWYTDEPEVEEDSHLSVSFVFMILMVAVILLVLLVSIFVFAVIRLMQKRNRDDAATAADNQGQTARGVPLAMQLPTDSPEVARGTLPDGQTAPDPARGPPRDESHLLFHESRVHPLRGSGFSSHPERDEPLHHHHSRPTPLNSYPEALPHDPVMAYYDSEFTDPHLYQIGHEYQHHLFVTAVNDDEEDEHHIHEGGNNNNNSNDKDAGSKPSVECSELEYGHARYLSETAVSSIASADIVFYDEGEVQCERDDKDP